MTNQPTTQLQFDTHPVAWAELSPAQLRRHVATHEAGHALVGAVVGLQVVDVAIDLTPSLHPDGGVVFAGTRFDAPGGDMNALARERPAETAVALMAGLCAEELLLGAHLRESWIGDLRILRIGHSWIGGRRQLPPELISYLNEAHSTVTRSETAIRAIAELLVHTGHLTADQVDSLRSP